MLIIHVDRTSQCVSKDKSARYTTGSTKRYLPSKRSVFQFIKRDEFLLPIAWIPTDCWPMLGNNGTGKKKKGNVWDAGK